MTVKNVFLGGSGSFENGTLANAVDVNDTFNAAAYRLLGSLPATANSGSTVNCGSILVAGSALTSFVQVFVDYYAENGTLSSTGDQRNFFVYLNIGSPTTTQVQNKKVAYGQGDNNEQLQTGGTVVFNYIPTASEKNNGFYVHVSGSTYTTNQAPAPLTIGSVYIFGR